VSNIILIADAAPVIFLAKINQLTLISELFDADILVPSVIQNEILCPNVPPDEERLLSAFLSNCKVVDLRNPDIFAKALSFADNCVLTLAHKEHADFVLSDDRLFRRVAVIEGFRVVGTLGILLQAKRGSLISKENAVGLLDQLVEEHSFRISTRVYEAVRKTLSS
jgi:predicted nucleic acid-binding protein